MSGKNDLKGMVKGTPFRVEIALPPALLALSQPMQDEARFYLGARRRSGAALLDAAKALAKARALAQHGEWQVFLSGTNTSADTAERLINIHTLAAQDPQFEAAVKDDWLSQTSAALLARPSTPPEVVAELLNAPTPPTQEQITARTRQAKRTPQNPHNAESAPVQNPQNAEFASPIAGPSNTEPPFTPEETLHEIARVLAHLTRDAHQLPHSDTLFAALDQVELALSDLRREIAS